MKVKTLILLLMLSSVMLSGCTDDKTTDGGINATDNVSNISTENVTTDTTNITSLNESEQNVTTTAEEQPAVNVPAANVSTEDTTSTGPKVVDTGVSRTFTVRLEKFLSSPSTLVVAPKDTVYWINFNDPKRLFVLVSEDGLWENKNIGYRESFGYTFNETGTFNYSITGNPRMNGTIIVK
jgi:plastocyanin